MKEGESSECGSSDHSRTPLEYLKGVTLTPRNFDMPEKPIHGALVDLQLKHDLFNMTYNKVMLTDGRSRVCYCLGSRKASTSSYRKSARPAVKEGPLRTF